MLDKILNKKPKIRICVVVTGENMKEFLDNLDKAQKETDLVELRVDYIKNLELEDLDIIKKKLKKKAIFTFRKKDEGGKAEISEEERLKFINKAVKLFDYIDIEFSSIDKESAVVKNAQNLIVSYHDFEKTPPYEDLEKILNDMAKTEAGILKLVTMSNGRADNFNLMKLLVKNKTGKNVIILGMGEEGRPTRILAPLKGSYLTYASINKSSSAPGQIDVEEMKQLYKFIKI